MPNISDYRRANAFRVSLDDSVLQYGAFRETRTPNLLITNQLHYQLCYEGIVTTARTPAVIGGFPAHRIGAFEALPNNKEFYFLNSKSNR